MAVILTPPYLQFLDDNGDPLSGGKVFTYAAGTTTPKETFTTPEANIESPNPLILDSSGRVLAFGQGTYRFDVFDSDDNLIRTSDDVATFTASNEVGDPFFQSFSGNGSQTVFTLMEPLGNNSKDVLVFVDNSDENLVTNGTFAADSDWTKGSGWAISAGTANATTSSDALSQTSGTTLIQDNQYSLTYTVTRTVGSVTPSIGGTDGTERSADGTYTELITCGAGQDFVFTGNGFTGTIDNVIIRQTQGTSYEIQNPSFFTLSGTTLTFNTAPPEGTNNIYVFAPTKLLGAASAAADNAQDSETAAAASAAEAASSAGLVTVTSTSSVAIGAGAKSFTVASGLNLNQGQWVLISSDADEDNFMWGPITSYASTTLQVDVQLIGGSGTFSDWTIRLTGPRGVDGIAGSVTATSAVTAATSAGASLNASNDSICASWGAADGQNFTVTNTLSFGAGGATVTGVLDEDDMASDSATKLATQQSIKAYVDNEIAGVSTNILHVRHTTASSTNGGAISSGSWAVRTLNTTVQNSITGASLGSNKVTLPAGTYKVMGYLHCYNVNTFQSRLWNDSDSSEISLGLVARSASGVGSMSHVFAQFTLASQKDIELQNQVAATNATNGAGLGAETSWGTNVFAELIIEKIG